MLPSSSSYHKHWKQYNAQQTWPRKLRSIMLMSCTCCIFLMIAILYHTTTVSGQHQMIMKLEQLNQEHQQQIARHIDQLTERERLTQLIQDAHDKAKQQISELTQQLQRSKRELENTQAELQRMKTQYSQLHELYEHLQQEKIKLLEQHTSHPQPHHDTPITPSPHDDLPRKEINEHIEIPDIVDMTTIIPQQQQQQHDRSTELSHILGDASTIEKKRLAIRHEFEHAWNAYELYAWGKDELHPVSKRGDGGYHMGLTIIDALDTIIIMGLDSIYTRCRTWIRDELQFGQQEDINVFETTIRILGGLLSAYALKNDRLFLDRAEDLAQRMMIAFDSKTGLPYGTLGLKSGKKYNPSWAGGSSTVAEVGSIQLEWQYLSRVTGKPIYAEKVDAIMHHLHSLHRPLLPQFISVDSGQLTSNVITMGARVDSVYEYYLKQWLLSGKTKELPKEMYIDSMKAVHAELVTTSHHSKLKFIAELHDGKKTGKMDHLVCFVPGMLALGAYNEVVPEPDRSTHLELASELTHTCHEFYQQTATKLAPEIVQFVMSDTATHDFDVDPHAQHCMLRPETMESYFIMWRVTHDEKYRNWGWEMFESFVRYARLSESGYSGLRDVRVANRPNDGVWSNWDDKMESFFLAETFKYLYLMFSDDDVIPLDKYVFNTEAHPLPIAEPPAHIPLEL